MVVHPFQLGLDFGSLCLKQATPISRVKEAAMRYWGQKCIVILLKAVPLSFADDIGCYFFLCEKILLFVETFF